MTRPASLPSDASPRFAGLDDGFSKAFEVAFTPVVFCGIGFVIDRLAGTTPLFMVLATGFGIVGTFVRLWYRYAAAMNVEQERAIAGRRAADARHGAAACSATFEVTDASALDLGVLAGYDTLDRRIAS